MKRPARHALGCLCPTRTNAWKPGTFVSARIVLAAEPVRTLVPNDAIQTVNNQPVSLCPQRTRPLTRTPVTVGRSNSTHSQILAGLEPGDRYVMNGAFVLKAELGKGEGGHDTKHLPWRLRGRETTVPKREP